MTDKRSLRISAEANSLRAVLIILLAIYGILTLGSIFFVFRVFPSVLKTPSGTSVGTIAEMARLLIERVVPGAVFFVIGWDIFKLIALVSRKAPFNPASPRYARRIGYSVLLLAAGAIIVDVFRAFRWPVEVLSGTFISAVLGVLTTLLIGFGFLVIAKVLEVGVRLQQDQNLTV